MTFEGFMRPVKNYFPMPNEWINICAEIDNLAELKIVQYVLRHTWGYHEYGITKHITVEEFMHGRKRQDGTRIDNGTGLKSDRSVKDGIKAATLHGYLVCEMDTTDLARIKKSYALKMLSPILEETEGYNLPPTDDRQVVSTPLTGSIYPSEVQHLPLGGTTSTPRSEKDTLEKHLEKDTLERQEGEGANAPTPAHLKEIVDEELEKVETVQRRITGEHPAVQPTDTESHYPIAVPAIGNEEEEFVLSVPRITLQSKTPSQQAPGPGQPLPPAADPPVGRHGDAASVQAISAPLVPLSAQAGTSPPAGSVRSGTAPTAQASVFVPPKRPSGKRPPTMPEPPKEITLTPQEAAFWGLWRDVWFNRDIKPDLTPTAYSHVKRLCPYITTAELLNSLIDYARKDLQESKGIKRKAVQLGNLVNSYRGWKQEQAAQAPPPKKKGTDFDIYVGNGEEEREAVYQEGLRRLAEGTLIE